MAQADDGLPPTVAEADAIQQELDALQKEFDDKVIELQQAYNVKKAPFFAKRGVALGKIPQFWGAVLSNHPVTGECLGEQDDAVLDAITSLTVDEDKDGGFKITMAIGQNDLTEAGTYWKEFDERGEPKGYSEVKWKPGKKPESSFFDFFTNEDPEACTEIGAVIKEELWNDPLPVFLDSDEGMDEEA